MGNEEKLSEQKIPGTKNVWLRWLKITLIALVLSYGNYWFMSQMEVETLIELNNKRSRMFLAMLSIMPPVGWFWFFYLGMTLPAFWYEWRYYHFKSFPKEEKKKSIADKRIE